MIKNFIKCVIKVLLRLSSVWVWSDKFPPDEVVKSKIVRHVFQHDERKRWGWSDQFQFWVLNFRTLLD